MSFFTRLQSIVERRNTLLCIGLDPRAPQGATADAIIEQNKRIIGETAEYAACFKPNIAFYEAHGPAGFEALQETIRLVPDGIPVLIDAKRGDVGATAEAYAEALFGFFHADAVTYNPYLGKSSADPLLAWPDRGIFAVCRTSNPGAARIQELPVPRDHTAPVPLYLEIARECLSWGDNVGLVVAANDTDALVAMRAAHPDVWILAPGIGPQGGSAGSAVAAGVREDGSGILPVVVRAISDADDPAAAARAYRDEVNASRHAGSKIPRPAAAGGSSAHAFLDALIESGCFKLGSFVLKSGLTSPFYIDLRIASSSPDLLRSAARAYASMMGSIRCDRIAGIPVAALPFAAALSLETGIPLIYPRMSAKGHGTGNTVEGTYRAGDRVALVDDLITTGASKIEAVTILREAGLEVTDLVVLLERGEQGRKDMESVGVRLHAYAHIFELFERCKTRGLIDDRRERELKDFAAGRS